MVMKYGRPRYLVACLVCQGLLLWSVPVFSAPIDGFRDLKFGMTQQEVKQLDACATAKECLYELEGKNRYVYPFYQNSAGEPVPSHQKPSPRLVRLTIGMGAYTEEWYAKLQMLLERSYTLTHHLTEPEIIAFRSEKQSELTVSYEQSQVLLKIVRRKFGNLVLKVIYQTNTMAKDSRQRLPH